MGAEVQVSLGEEPVPEVGEALAPLAAWRSNNECTPAGGLEVGQLGGEDALMERQRDATLVERAVTSAQSLPKACDFNPFCVGTLTGRKEGDTLIGEQGALLRDPGLG